MRTAALAVRTVSSWLAGWDARTAVILALACFPGTAHAESSEDLIEQGRTAYTEKRYDDAEALFEKAVSQAQAENPESLDVAEALRFLGFFKIARGNFEESVPVFDRVVAITGKVYGLRSLEYAVELNDQAVRYRIVGRYGDSENHLLRAVAIDDQLGAEARGALAVALNNLGQQYTEERRHQEALPLLKRSVQLKESLYDEDDPTIAYGLTNLSIALMYTGRIDDAETALLRAIEIDKRHYGEDHSETLADQTTLAHLRMLQGNLGEAEALNVRILDRQTENFGPESQEVSIVLANAGKIHIAQRRYSDAVDKLRRALEIRRQIYRDNHPGTGEILYDLAIALERSGQNDEAEATFKEAISICRAGFGRNNPLVREMAGAFAAFLKKTDRPDEARDYEALATGK